MRNALLILITGLICVISPINPLIGLCGYYWFALMRPDVLAWSGANNYSFFIAIATLLSNFSHVLANITVLVSSWLCRTFLLFLVSIGLSVVFSPHPELCTDQVMLFARVAIMALLIPLAIRSMRNLQLLLLVMAGSIGLLGSKFGLWGLMRGGAKFSQGFGGMLSDNNTMALAFAMAVPLCWFSRMLAPSRILRAGLAAAALLNAAAVVFTHSRGGALAVGVAMLLIGWRSKHRIATALVILLFMGGAVYQVRDSFGDRMATLSAPEDEASAYSRIVLAQSGLKLWRDYPLFGVGFTETNEQELIGNYVPSENAEAYARKVLHNTYVQVLVDTGILGIVSYLTLLLGGCFALGRSIKRRTSAGLSAAVPMALQSALITYAVGSAFLSRTSFDFLYILLMVAAAWFQLEPLEAAQRPVEAVPQAAIATPAPQPAPAPAPQLPIGPRTARERRALLRRDR